MSQQRKRTAPRFGVYRPTASDAFALKGQKSPLLGGSLRFASWNIHWGAGAELEDARRFSRREVSSHLEQIVALVQAQGVDVLALQEVDRDCLRSAEIDQLTWLREKTGLEHASFATTWDAAWVPHPITAPPSQQYGRMWSGQAVLSRFPIKTQRRHALPQPARNGRLYNRFYLHRCIQELVLDLGDERSLRVYNVHLEAFDNGNRRAQARILARLLRQCDGEGICLGDFNALPPQAAQLSGFVDEPDTDFHGDDTMASLLATGWQGLGAGHTFPAHAPSRRLDHVLLSPGLKGTLTEPLPSLASDHLPLFGALENRNAAPKL